MPPVKVTCPECNATLRPAKPLPAGKSVKCPKCGAGFVVGGDAPAKAKSKPRPSVPAPSKKKPAADRRPPVASVLPAADGAESGATYALAGGSATEEEETGPEINYAPDLSIKDLRGPAMEAIVSPSNKLILVGVSGFIGWVAFTVILLIPILFPNVERKKDQDTIAFEQLRAAQEKAKAGNKPKKEEEEVSFLKIGDIDLRKIIALPWYFIVPCFIPMVLGMAYSVIVSLGAVSVQNLESRRWGILASIMAMFPINAGGLIIVMALSLNIALDFLFEGWYKWFMLGLFLVCIWGTNLAVGIWLLSVLKSEAVVAGFEYVPD